MPWPEVGDVYIRTLLNERKKKPLSALSVIVLFLQLIALIFLPIMLLA